MTTIAAAGFSSPVRAAAGAAALLLSACAAQTASVPSPLQNPPQENWALQCKEWDDWDKPGPPFQIFGNTYYVGTCEITAILVTGDAGHILIDGGPARAAPLIASNIKALGFDLAEVKLLLHSHEHHDHVGGLAELQRLTGAQLIASPEAAPALASGKAGPGDPQAGSLEPFPAARVDSQVRDGEVVRLGNLALRAIATPGHTPGALSWHWTVPLGPDSFIDVTYADSLSPVSSDSYRFSDHPEYLSAYRASIAKIAALNCRTLLTPHPSASGMREGIVNRMGISSRTACKDYAARLVAGLDERLAKEATVVR